MTSSTASILALNAGSSSIKFGVYTVAAPLQRTLVGQLEREPSGAATLTWRTATGTGERVRVSEYGAPALIDWLERRHEFETVVAAGHRVVHGMSRTEPQRLTPPVIDELRRTTPFAPNHLPAEMTLIAALAERHPDLSQVACFDTAFHQAMPAVAKLLPIPRRYYTKGVQRYGFHGLSYAYLVEELARIGGAEVAPGRVILAHLGNGASLAAVRDGRSVDTSMGFTPASGLVMSTRPGDLDPGAMSFLANTEQMTAQQFDALVNHESGLLGVSEISSDMRELLAREGSDRRAAEAVALFCYQAKKWIGAFTAVLGGLDTLVFSGGIGEHSAPIRARICDGLTFVGIALDHARNLTHADVISTDNGGVIVRVMHTDEELMIARSVYRVLGLHAPTTEGHL